LQDFDFSQKFIYLFIYLIFSTFEKFETFDIGSHSGDYR